MGGTCTPGRNEECIEDFTGEMSNDKIIWDERITLKRNTGRYDVD
jgi:hypothetical protein